MIEITNLQKRYGNLTVLRDVTVSIRKGDVISIIGPSGAGKTTFLRCLNLLDIPTGGSIKIDNEDILGPKADVPRLRRKMGMVFQSFNLFDHLTVMENLTIGPLKLLKRSREEARHRGMELLKMVGLAEKADFYPEQLSGGQKQRVAIARCLSIDPEIILFDEPTSALDPTMVSEVLGVIRALAKQGMTMAIVTHELGFARDVSSRVLYMDEGTVYEEGSPKTIFENPLREKTRAFIHRIRSFNYTIPSRNLDLYELNGAALSFCSKYFLSEKQSQSILLVIEELTQLLPLDKPVNLSMEYSEKDQSFRLKVTRENYSAPVLTSVDADPLGMAIIRGLCREVRETVTNNQLHIELTLNF